MSLLLARKVNFSMVMKRLSSFSVEPAVSHVSEIVKIRGSGFKPFQKLTLKASLELPSEKLDFISFAHIQTNKNGSFDMSETESTDGSYVGKEPMGLFWSMSRKNDSSMTRLQVTNGTISLPYKIQAYENFVNDFSSDNKCLHETTIQRNFLTKGVKRVLVREGNLRGTIFIPEGDGPFPTIITIQGGTKNRQIAEDSAAFLASHGFVCFALAFFIVDDLPKDYSVLNIEYFEEAINFIAEQRYVDESSIGIFGTSKGGDVSLGIMSHFSNIRSVVYVNGAITSIGGLTTYKGFTVEDAALDLHAMHLIRENTVDITNVVDDPRNKPSSIHPFYRSKADLLMVVGLDDHNYRSELFASIAKDIMDATGKKNYEIQRYKGLGHLLDAPYSPVCAYTNHVLVPPPMMIYFGGSDSKLHSKAQLEAWDDIISFFKKTLCQVNCKL